MSFFAAPLSNVTGTFTPTSFIAYTVSICAAFCSSLWSYAVRVLERVHRAFDWSFELPRVIRRALLVAPPRPPALGKLSLVACWASFLLATTAHADTGVASSGFSPSAFLAGALALLGGGYAIFKLGAKLAAPVLAKGIDLGAAAVKAKLSAVPYLKAHPDELAVVLSFVDFVDGRLKLGAATAVTDVEGSSSGAAALAKVVADEKTIALGVANLTTLTAILTNAGVMLPGQSLASWIESLMGHLLTGILPQPPLGTAGSVAVGAGPISQSGFAASRLALVLGLLGALTFAACSAAQKATEVADAKALEAQVIDCGKAEVQAALPSATGDVLPLLTGGAADTTALEALAVKDGLEVAVCATEAVVKDALAALAKPPDGGASIAVTDCQRVWVMESSARTFLAAHAHKPAPKRGGAS